MAYKQPGVTVTQEFSAAPTQVVGATLPAVAIGPAYQLVTNDLIGTYAGSALSCAYASMLPVAYVDLAWPIENDPTPAIRKNISVTMKNAVIGIMVDSWGAYSKGTAFKDDAMGAFSKAKKGDQVVIKSASSVEVIAARADGVSTHTVGMKNRLTSATSGQFAYVQAGDRVTITGGLSTATGTYTVSAVLNASTLLLSADINTGSSDATDVAFSIAGDRGTASAGKYTIKEVVSANHVTLESPLPSDEGPLLYSVTRKLGTLPVGRVSDASENGFFASEASVSLPTDLEVLIDGMPYYVTSGDIYASYRALRTDMYSQVLSYASIADIQAAFGADQIDPANPLAFALKIMLDNNTASAAYGLGLNKTFYQDESLAYTQALDALEVGEYYALAPLSVNPVVHGAFKNHCEQLSIPDMKLERIALINSTLKASAVVQSEVTTSVLLAGSRTVVSSQMDGAAAVSSPARLLDSTPNQYANVLPGDTVLITGGTGVTLGAYSVVRKTSANELVLDANFVTAGSPTDILYTVYRKDGLAGDGETFVDRSAAFIANGVAPGHKLIILTGAYAGSYPIAAVVSDKEIKLAQAIPGATTLQSGVKYRVDRALTKDEQATSVAGYSAAFGSRRVYHVWPDYIGTVVGQNVVNVPGYFAAVAVAAWVSGFPTQVGFTNKSLVGFIQQQHSSRYFTDTQLNMIADGGTMVLAQDGDGQVLYVRHQLSTDRSSIKFQELSITKNVDFLAKTIRSRYRRYIGQYNIVDTTLDALRSEAAALITYFKETLRIPRYGGAIRFGSLVSLKESATQIDAVEVRFNFAVPVPLNDLDITIAV